METKQAIAIEIGLQTQVLKSCPVHRQIYFDEEVNPAGAFALAIELVRKYKRYAEEFHHAEHELLHGERRIAEERGVIRRP